MPRPSFQCLLTALALACLPAASHAQEARGLPQHLGDTGLYVAGSLSQLSADVQAFSPQYPLWSDGAGKRRWIYLPPGTSIDASSPDAWRFPRGTRLWKEFTQGRALETRYMELSADGHWRYGSYVWSADGKDAQLAASAGVRELPATGVRHSIPSEDDCRACHEGANVPVLGFSALQLSPDRDPLAPHAERAAGTANLRTLVARGVLRNLPARLVANPPRIAAASPAERAALGYLHGNCGHCHNDTGPLALLEMNLAQRVAGASATAAVLDTVVGVRSQFRPAGVPAGAARISPGHLQASVIAARMNSRNPSEQMPPLGTRAVDTEAVALLARWIESLPTL